MEYLSYLDYLLFFGMLIVSALIGIYFGYFAPEKQNTVSQYLMGGRKMGVFPVSMSLVASFISGISILGIPAEMYLYGTLYSWMIITFIMNSFMMAFVFVPVYHKLQITSSYEYLEKRFNYKVKIFGSILFIILQMLYIPVVVYVPALALNQVTGLSMHLITPVVCLICIFYTCVGGIKAVVWTDTVQIIVMLIALIIVSIMGLINLGGFKVVFERATITNRLEFFKLELSLRTRITLWSALFGDFFHTMATCAGNQAIVQRCLALPNVRKAQLAVGIFAVGHTIIEGFCCFLGLIIYAIFHRCDPLITKTIEKPDQLLPLFVARVGSQFPGLTGIFLAGVFSASLSTMSTGLNSLTGVIYDDIIKSFYRHKPTESNASFIMKIIVIVIGLLCVGSIFIIQKMGTLIEVCMSLGGITCGALLGMFILGMFFPWANEKGALYGGIVSTLIIGWISINTQIQIHRGNIVHPRKQVSIQGCSQLSLNKTTVDILDIKSPSSTPFILYGISSFWYTFIGTMITIIVGLIVSYIYGFNDIKKVDRDLLTPVIHRFLPVKEKSENNDNENSQTQKINHLEKTSSKISLNELNPS